MHGAQEQRHLHRQQRRRVARVERARGAGPRRVRSAHCEETARAAFDSMHRLSRSSTPFPNEERFAVGGVVDLVVLLWFRIVGQKCLTPLTPTPRLDLESDSSCALFQVLVPEFSQGSHPPCTNVGPRIPW